MVGRTGELGRVRSAEERAGGRKVGEENRELTEVGIWQRSRVGGEACSRGQELLKICEDEGKTGG